MPVRRLLITGASGFLGQAVVRSLAKGPDTLVLTSRRRPDSIPAGASWQSRDLRVVDEAVQLFAEVLPTHVIDCAIARSEHGWGVETLRIASALAAAIATHRPTQLVHAGSQYEYGQRPGPHSEGGEAEPHDPYGEGKRSVRLALEGSCAAAGVRACVLRIYSVYGPGEPMKRFIPTVVRRALAGSEIATTDAAVEHDFVFIEDVAEAFRCALDVGAAGVFNVGSGTPRSNVDVARLVVKLTGSSSHIAVGAYPRKDRDRVRWYADRRRAARELHWQPNTRFEDGLLASIEDARRMKP